jgi:ribosomal protein L16 Arg81 hydroxylase
MSRFRQLGEQMMEVALAGNPCVFRACVAMVSETEAFAWLKDASARYDSARDGRTLRTIDTVLGRTATPARDTEPWVRRPQFVSYVGQHLSMSATLFPKRGDENLSGYFERIRQVVGGEEFGFQLPNLEGANEDAFLRFREMAQVFTERIGSRVMRFNSFYGDYRRTPFGIHADPHHSYAFQYIVHGTKTLRVWDTAALRDALGELELVKLFGDPNNYEGDLPDGQTFVAEPGDVLFWPGKYAHCLESTGPNLGLGFIVESTGKMFEDALRFRLSKRVSKHLDKTTASGNGSDLADPRRVREALQQLAAEINSDEAECELVLDLLSMNTGRGSVGVLPPKDRNGIDLMASIDSRIPDGASIECLSYRGALRVAANGLSTERSLPENGSTARELIACLRNAQALPVKTVLQRFSASLEEGTIVELIEFLAAAHAIQLTRIDDCSSPEHSAA